MGDPSRSDVGQCSLRSKPEGLKAVRDHQAALVSLSARRFGNVLRKTSADLNV